MSIFLTVLHVMVCFVLIIVVLLQRGKGAEIGAVFGGGGSTTVFGSRGAGNFLTKLTTGSAIVFMATSLFLSYLGGLGRTGGLFEGEAPPAAEETSPFQEPAAPLADGVAPSAPAETARPGAKAPAAPASPEAAPAAPAPNAPEAAPTPTSEKP